jgi:hypothetical protein
MEESISHALGRPVEVGLGQVEPLGGDDPEEKTRATQAMNAATVARAQVIF